MPYKHESTVKRQIFHGLLALLTISFLMAGCSNSKLRRTPTAERDTPWFCEMNENRDNWQCVQDAELARHPQPQRLPGDEETIEEDEILPLPLIAPSVTFSDPDSPAVAEAGQETEPLAPLVSSGAVVAQAQSDNATLSGRTSAELLALSGDQLAVQLIAVANLELAAEFNAEHGLEDSMNLRLARDGEFYVVVLMGVYDTYADAEAAVASRGESLDGISPWIRPLHSIQRGLQEAADLLAANGQ